MGLLDSFSSALPDFLPEDPNKREAARAGLLNFGAAMMMHANKGFGGAFGQGLLSGGQGYSDTLEGQQKAALQAMQAKHYSLQNDELQAKIDQPKRMQEILAGVGGGIPSGNSIVPFGQPGVPTFARMPPFGSNAGFAQSTSAPVNPAGQAEAYQKYIAYGDALSKAGYVEQAKQYYTIADQMRPKIKEQKNLRDAKGNIVTANVYDDGRTETVNGYTPAEKLHFANTGGATVGMDQYTGVPVYSIRNTQTPDSVAARAQAERHYQGGKVPPGYRIAADGRSLEAIPGGPAAIGKALPGPAVKDLSSAGAAVENTQRLRDSFKDDYGNKYILGSAANTYGRLFGDDTGQAQFWQDLDAQQNVTRNQLFGSALTRPELESWEKTSVNPRMDSGEIRKNLTRRAEIEARAASKLARAYSAAGYNKDQINELLGSAAEFINTPAPPTNPPATNAAPRVGTVQQGFRFKGGDPSKQTSWEKL